MRETTRGIKVQRWMKIELNGQLEESRVEGEKVKI